MSFLNFLKNCHDKNTGEQYKRGSVLEFEDERADEIVGAGVAKKVATGGGSTPTEEVLIQGWTSITPDTFFEIDMDTYAQHHKFTTLIYVRKGSNREAVKFELTKEELNKLISKATTHELVNVKACCGISNTNNVAMIKRTIQRPTQDSAGMGVLKIKYQMFEGGSAVSGLDNFEYCMYAE